MDIQSFIQQLEDAIDGITKGSTNPTTNFKDIEQWDSMAALTVIGMVDSEYGIQISSDDLLQCKTVEELFNIVKARKQ